MDQASSGVSSWFLRTGAVIVVIGMALGLFMAMSEDHRMMPVHAHLNVIGWLSFFAIGLYYRVFPESSRGSLPVIQYWLLLIGIVVMAVALAMLMSGGGGVFGPIAGLGGLLLLIGMFLFAVTVFSRRQNAAA
jgi:uncharacterized membrane protein YgdD (TMEM256/DUF423 family)